MSSSWQSQKERRWRVKASFMDGIAGLGSSKVNLNPAQKEEGMKLAHSLKTKAHSKGTRHNDDGDLERGCSRSN